MLLLDEVPAQDDVLPSLRILPAHSGEEGRATVSTGGTQCTPATAHWLPPPQGCPAGLCQETPRVRMSGAAGDAPNAAQPGRAT